MQPPRLSRVGPAALGLLLALLLLARPAEPTPPFPPDIARWVRDLGARPGLRQRLTQRLAQFSPALTRRLPALLDPDAQERRRLEACHALLARIPETRAAAPALTRLLLQRLHQPARSALSGDPTPWFTFLVLAHSGQPASDLVEQARQSSGGLGPLTRFCAGLLNTEDEPVRRLAQHTLQAAARPSAPCGPELPNAEHETWPAEGPAAP